MSKRSRSAHFALCFLAIYPAIALSAVNAQEPGAGIRSAGFHGFTAGGGKSPYAAQADLPIQRWQDDLASAHGLLLVGENYVPLPLEFRLDGEQLLINGFPVQAKSQPQSPDRPRRTRPGAEARQLGGQIVQNLSSGYLVIAMPDQPLVIVPDSRTENELFKTLMADGGGLNPVAVRNLLNPGVDAAAWNAWLAAFKPTEDFRRVAAARVEQFERLEAEGASVIAAARRLNTWSYPLSLLGMVATTLGIGHLLSHRPPVDARSLETDTSPLAIRVLSYSLMLVIVYSALDLIWTILAHQAGQMLELNPLGSHLIENPLHLIAFKSAATALAVVLLFSLRKYRQAQLAAWWVCLVCTLLTARWLTISPMFAT